MQARQCSLVTGLDMRGSKRRHSAILSLPGRSTRRRPSVPTMEGSAAASSSNAREAVIFRRAEEGGRLGDAGAVEVAVERHEREALCLGRKGHDVCLPAVARAGPSISQCDSQKRQVDLPALLDEGEAGLEHPSDSIACGVLEGERHGDPQGRFQRVAVLYHGLHRLALEGGWGERHAEDGPPLQGVQPLTIRAGCQSTSPEKRAMTG